jgi:hypothetical protein
MHVKGHPKKPISREDLPLGRLVDSFLEQTREEDEKLFKYLDDLDDDGKNQLGGVLGRFDQKGKGQLEPSQRLLARRVLVKLHRPTQRSLVLTNKILDYLDLDRNALIDDAELALCTEILELFSTADSVNDTLSEFELDILYAVLRYLDINDNGCLDSGQKMKLRDGLRDPVVFLEREMATNPLVKELYARR